MVWKVMSIICAALIIWACPCSALADSVYQGTISTTYSTMFRDVVSSLPAKDDYVFFRSGDQVYTLVAGDLEYKNGSFSLNGTGKKYVITNVSGSGAGYSSYYSYQVTSTNNFTLSPGNYLIYSNLGDYPTLEERGVQYEFSTMFLICVIAIVGVIRPLYKYCLRDRRGITG